MKKLGVIAVSMLVLCGALFAAEESTNKSKKAVEMTFYGNQYKGTVQLDDVTSQGWAKYSLTKKIANWNGIDLPNQIGVVFPLDGAKVDIHQCFAIPSCNKDEKAVYGNVSVCAITDLKNMYFTRVDEETGAVVFFIYRHVKDAQEALKDGRAEKIAQNLGKWNLKGIMKDLQGKIVDLQVKATQKSSQPQGHPRADSNGHIWPSK